MGQRGEENQGLCLRRGGETDELRRGSSTNGLYSSVENFKEVKELWDLKEMQGNKQANPSSHIKGRLILLN